jgi:phage anti-repressor protein
MTMKNTANTGRGQTHPKESLGIINSNDFSSLVPVISGQVGGCESNIVSAKALHKALGVGNDFSTWIKLRIDEYGFVLGADYVVFDSSDFRNQSAKLDQLESGWVTKRGGDRRSKDYGLSLNMAKELAMVERNDQGRAIRRYFIQCEDELYRSVPEIAARLRHQLKTRIGAANMFKAMCTALEAARAEQGKQTSQNHYTNESNMIARIVLGGITAKQWALASDIDGDPRDKMSAEQLEHISYLETTNITLIDMGMDYEPRKTELMRLSQRWLTKRLGSENDDK